MSFKCDKCNEAQPNDTKPNRVVVETRSKTYVNKGNTSVGTEIVNYNPRKSYYCRNTYRYWVEPEGLVPADTNRN